MILKSISVYNEDIATAIAAIKLEDSDFYFILATTQTQSEIKTIAGIAETSVNLYVFSTLDNDVLTTATNDVLSELQALAYDNTAGVYSADAYNAPEGAWVGLTAPEDAGRLTWGLKNVSGIVADVLTDTEVTKAIGKNANIYVERGGIDVFLDGKVVGGEWIDIIRGTVWIAVNMEADVYQAIVKVKKVPFTNNGATIIRTAIEKVLKQAITMDILTNDPAPVIFIPDVADVSDVNKKNRYLPDITFTTEYSGAIQKTAIAGNISI